MSFSLLNYGCLTACFFASCTGNKPSVTVTREESARTAWEAYLKGKLPSASQRNGYQSFVRASVASYSTTQAILPVKAISGKVSAAQSSQRRDGYKIRASAKPVLVSGCPREANLCLGIPVSLQTEKDGSDSTVPSCGIWVPKTALMRWNHDRQQLHFIDADAPPSWCPPAVSRSLCSDPAASVKTMLDAPEHKFGRIAALLSFDAHSSRTGLRRLSEVSANKQPCVLIHGINSNPATWCLTLSQLLRDPEIRTRYEFWVYGYPTGAPIHYSAARLRKALRDMIAYRRAKGAGNASITLIGHSMGGLLAKSATLTSGQREWDQFFRLPLDKLPLQPAERELLREMAFFKPVPGIRKVIFCATPHRGSEVASIPEIRLLSRLIEVPHKIHLLTRPLLGLGSGVFRAEVALNESELNAVNDLCPTADTTRDLLCFPLNPKVSYHSIIGRCDPSRPVMESSDGIVPYQSAHLDGVQSETVITASGHGVHQTPGGTAEIKRLLLLP